jgi:hypothetical protein
MKLLRLTLAILLSLLPVACRAQHGGFTGGGFHGGGFYGSRGGGHGGGLNQDDNRAALAITTFALLGMIGIFTWADHKHRRIGVLRIVAVPPGEAPETIRRAWVCVAIPLRRAASQLVTQDTIGVLSKEKTGRMTGYALTGSEAVEALRVRSQKAAAWWEDNAPHVLAPGYILLFPTKVCEAELF